MATESIGQVAKNPASTVLSQVAFVGYPAAACRYLIDRAIEGKLYTLLTSSLFIGLLFEAIVHNFSPLFLGRRLIHVTSRGVTFVVSSPDFFYLLCATEASPNIITRHQSC